MSSRVKSNSYNLDKAKAYAFRLLAVRQRSQKELCERLCRKKFSLPVINKAIGYLKEIGYINDRRFCEDWVRTKLKNYFGLARIRFELEQKGIDKETIERALNASTDDMISANSILDFAKLKYKKLLRQTDDPIKIKRRLYGFFLRRGFSPEEVLNALSKL